MCFQWAEEWQLCTGRCDYWHITQSRADGKERAVLLQLLWLSWMEHFYFFFYRVRERILTTDRNSKKKKITLKNDCCVLLLYFQPNRLHRLRALCEIYGSLFSWLKWTVASCISADGWLLFIWGISKNDNNPSLKKKQKPKRGKWDIAVHPGPLCVGRRRNVAGVCGAWMFSLYVVNRRKCWCLPAACGKCVLNFAVTVGGELVEPRHISQVHGAGGLIPDSLSVLPDGTRRGNTVAVDNIFCCPEF